PSCTSARSVTRPSRGLTSATRAPKSRNQLRDKKVIFPAGAVHQAFTASEAIMYERPLGDAPKPRVDVGD
ncbi:hypothetical protein CQA20_29565, partial [Klebsiella pneumoniae]